MDMIVRLSFFLIKILNKNLEVMCGPVSGVAERLSRIVGGAFEAVWNRELHARLVHVVIANLKLKN